jgi:hypothetical protein
VLRKACAFMAFEMLIERMPIESLFQRIHSLGSFARLSATILVATVPVIGFADSYTFTDTASSIKALAHGTAYTWGLSPTANSTNTTLGSLEAALDSGKTISSVTLTIDGLYDWTKEPDDVLYVNILNNVEPGNNQHTYNPDPATVDTSYGHDIFDVVAKPTPPTKPVAPVAPVKPVNVKPTAPVAPKEPAHPTHAQVLAYQAALAAYDIKLANYNAALAIYNANAAAYAAAVVAYNAAKVTYNADEAAYTTAEATYKANLLLYTNYTSTQGALGYTGVTNQVSSLLVSPGLPSGDPGTWSDPGNSGSKDATNLVVTFTSANIGLLTDYLEEDSPTTDVGLGFGPDCHYYDSGFTLNVVTAPDSGTTFGLLGIALLALVGIGIRVKRPRVGA